MISNYTSTAENGSLLKHALVMCCLFGMYTRAGTLFPFDYYLIPGIFSFLLYFRSSNILIKTFHVLIFFILHFIIIFLQDTSSSEILDQLSSFVLFILTLFASLGFYSVLIRIKRSNLIAILSGFILFIIIFAFFERIDILKFASDSFRLVIYDDGLVYKNDSRDLSGYGFVRPKVFASEPSYLGQFFGTSLLGVFLVYRGRYSLTKATVSILAFLSIVGSYTAGAGYLMIWLQNTFLRQGTIKSIVKRKYLFIILGFIVAVFIINQFAVRLGFFGGDIGTSVFIRILGPARLALESLTVRPFLGFGLGAENSLLSLVNSIYNATDTPEYVLQNYSTRVVAGSYLFSIIWQFGIIGTIIFIILLYRLFFAMSHGNARLLFLFFLIQGLSVADLHTPGIWMSLALVAACQRISTQRR